MPKPLFYLGVIFSALAAVLAVSAAPALLDPARPAVFSALGPLQPLTILLITIPIAALFVRMASLLAARNLFAAQFAIFSIACTTIAAALLSTMQFRLVLLAKSGSLTEAIRNSTSEIHVVMLYAVGFFLSVSLLAVRPYFRIQGRAIAMLLLVPFPLYVAMLLEQYLSAPTAESMLGVSSSLTFLYLFLVGTLFCAMSVHCLRHRHRFVEVTNLRELLDTRVDPTVIVRRRSGFRFDSDVAFDS